MPDRLIKRGPVHEINVSVEDGENPVRIWLKDGGGTAAKDVTHGLTWAEWDRLKAWVEWQRSELTD